MKYLFCIFLTFNTWASDLFILKENINRLNWLVDRYPNTVHPILERYQKDPHVVLGQAERKQIQNFWTLFNDTRIVLSTLAATYRSKNPEIVYAANLHLQYSGAVLSRKLWDNKLARKKLNETSQAHIPRGSFISLENELFKSFRANIQELPSYFPVSNLLVDKENMITSGDEELSILNQKTEAQLAQYLPFIQSEENYKTVRRRFISYKFKHIFYGFMKKISTWLGSTKVRNRNPDYYNGETLIKIKKAKKMEKKLLPGDIMLSRTDWFLSNVFLPGFWSHSFIYLGDAKNLRLYFDTPEIRLRFKKRCQQEGLNCEDIISYLQQSKQTQDAYKAYLKPDSFGFSPVLLEATSKGVHFSSIRYSFLNDYLAAVRPRVSKWNKAKAIIEAFSHHKKEYDFDFDFDTDDRLVCSEMVAKVYQPVIDFHYDLAQGKYLELFFDRVSLPVKNFVHKVYDENILNHRSPQLDFVAYLKGYSKLKNAFFVGEKEFYQTRGKAKWEFMH